MLPKLQRGRFQFTLTFSPAHHQHHRHFGLTLNPPLKLCSRATSCSQVSTLSQFSTNDGESQSLVSCRSSTFPLHSRILSGRQPLL
ncbi:hypothetical protein CPB83DRAFT_862404 [Crepidotus variabilis]|uniref:Uncharacterized protein n=1 Tax=Crepidotus variabilis TaxID=179855 RepID=A0A9P6JKD0_9AGAR|nr:hypothetical protein CPB83DRAFT_862404 [Crepidotus variabilis]